MCLSTAWLLRQDGSRCLISMEIITTLNKRGQVWREKYFSWFFELLARCRFTPNRVTFLRFLASPAFILFFPVYPRKMTLVLLVACLLDFVDGGLARHLRIADDRGKFWDVLVDHILYVSAIFTLMMTGAFSVPAFAYQLLIAPITYLLATLKESEGKKTDWIIHPYYTIVYFKPVALLVLVLYVGWGILLVDQGILLLNVAMTAVAVSHAIVLARRWSV